MSTNTTLWNFVLNQTIDPNTTKTWALYGASPENFYGFTLFGTNPTAGTPLQMTTGWFNSSSPSNSGVTVSITNSGSHAVICNVRAIEMSASGSSSEAVNNVGQAID